MAIEYKKLTWWYWLASAVLLTSGVAGNERAFMSLILLSSWQVLHFYIEDETLSSFRVQVRLGYVLIAVVAFWEPMRAIYLIPLCGTWANVLFGYCPLARFLTLMSWNHSDPLTIDLVWRTIVTPPTPGRFRPDASVVTPPTPGRSGPETSVVTAERWAPAAPPARSSAVEWRRARSRAPS